MPLIGAYTQHIQPYPMIKYGTWVSGLSLFFLAFGGPHLWPSVCFVVVLSLGEAIWSPRLYEYTAMIAPKGREGTYAALCSAPFFVAKLGAGALSGVVFQWFCPCIRSDCDPCCASGRLPGSCDGRMLWLVVGLSVIWSPCCITLLSRVIQGRKGLQVLTDDDPVPAQQPEARDEAPREDQASA